VKEGQSAHGAHRAHLQDDQAAEMPGVAMKAISV